VGVERQTVSTVQEGVPLREVEETVMNALRKTSESNL
jgi:hypothetical protein